MHMLLSATTLLVLFAWAQENVSARNVTDLLLSPAAKSE